MPPGRAARIGLWLLAVYGFLLGLSTLTTSVSAAFGSAAFVQPGIGRA